MKKKLVLLAICACTLGAFGQQITPVVFAGGGASRTIATKSGSSTAVTGASVMLPLHSGFFLRGFGAVSLVTPRASTSSPFWSPQFGFWAGRKLGQSRFAILGGPSFTQNRTGQYVVGLCGGANFRLSKRWTPLVVFNRSLPSELGKNQTWGVSATLGYNFNTIHLCRK